MKLLILISLIVFGTSAFSRDPGTGSNPTVGPGIATPDAGSSDTTIMGGGTPGRTEQDDKQFQEERREKFKKETEKRDITDQNSDLDTL